MDFTTSRKSCILFNLHALIEERQRGKYHNFRQKEYQEKEIHISGIKLPILTYRKEVKS
jgi:hypothetical protein